MHKISFKLIELLLGSLENIPPFFQLEHKTGLVMISWPLELDSRQQPSESNFSVCHKPSQYKNSHLNLKQSANSVITWFGAALAFFINHEL